MQVEKFTCRTAAELTGVNLDDAHRLIECPSEPRSVAQQALAQDAVGSPA